MIYAILKTIIDTTITQYLCQNCSGKIDENSVAVGALGEHEIHLDIRCPHCQAHAHIHAEVAQVQSQIIQTHGGLVKTLIPNNENAIKEEDIHTIEESLKSSQSMEDLLK